MRFLTPLARIALGVVLLAAGALKAADPSVAILTVGAYGILPPKLSLAVGFLLPGVEIAAGAALVTGFLLRGAAMLGAVLAIVFLFVTAWAQLKSLDITCGCFGPLSRAIDARWVTALIDVLMLAASAVVWRGTCRSARS
ncbi:MAG TPA: MauE/DoxX family redox-associated membrane protein [Planctomycetota bacterium]|nr:MauE/DoxX family redox-associated membrane protein [Planctomycetota bacterium]